MSDEEIRMRCLELAASLMGEDAIIDEMKEVAKELFIYVRGESSHPDAQINWEKINPDRAQSK